MSCKNTVEKYTGTHHQNKHLVECGTYWGGEKLLCESCLAKAKKMYPQGWRSYPGDTCQHGVYVGGCGEDFMCPQCEFE